jgi:hypothetical protein
MQRHQILQPLFRVATLFDAEFAGPSMYADLIGELNQCPTQTSSVRAMLASHFRRPVALKAS